MQYEVGVPIVQSVVYTAVWPSEQVSDAALVIVEGGAVVTAEAVCWGNATAVVARKESREMMLRRFILAVFGLNFGKREMFEETVRL